MNITLFFKTKGGKVEWEWVYQEFTVKSEML